jgi:hypothetical protein
MADIDAAGALFVRCKHRMEGFLQRVREPLLPLMTATDIKQTDDGMLEFYVWRRHRTHLEVKLAIIDFANSIAGTRLAAQRRLADPSAPDDDSDYGIRGNFCLSIVEEDHSRGRREIPFDPVIGWLDFSDPDGWELRLSQIEASEEDLALRIKNWFETGD